MNSVRSNNLSCNYQSFTPSNCKEIEIRKFEFVVKTQFLYVETLSIMALKLAWTDY